jgi:Putative restriction endonuclease
MASVLYTRSDVERLTQAGTFDGQRYELIEGELIRKSGQSPTHAWTLTHVYHWLANVFGLIRLRCQAPIEVAPEDQEHNEPEPDAAGIADPKFDHFTRHPRGDESLLLAEIADSTSPLDRTVKTALYAGALVPENTG